MRDDDQIHDALNALVEAFRDEFDGLSNRVDEVDTRLDNQPAILSEDEVREIASDEDVTHFNPHNQITRDDVVETLRSSIGDELEDESVFTDVRERVSALEEVIETLLAQQQQQRPWWAFWRKS